MKKLCLFVLAALLFAIPATAKDRRPDELLFGLNYSDVKDAGKWGQGSLESSWPLGHALRFGVRGSYIYQSVEGEGSDNAYTGGLLAGLDGGSLFVEAVGDYFVKKLDPDLNDVAPRYMYGVGVGWKIHDEKSLVKVRVGVDRLEGTTAEYYDRLTVGVAIGLSP